MGWWGEREYAETRKETFPGRRVTSPSSRGFRTLPPPPTHLHIVCPGGAMLEKIKSSRYPWCEIRYRCWPSDTTLLVAFILLLHISKGSRDLNKVQDLRSNVMEEKTNKFLPNESLEQCRTILEHYIEPCSNNMLNHVWTCQTMLGNMNCRTPFEHHVPVPYCVKQNLEPCSTNTCLLYNYDRTTCRTMFEQNVEPCSNIKPWSKNM
jgi:hypothetical protein